MVCDRSNISGLEKCLEFNRKEQQIENKLILGKCFTIQWLVCKSWSTAILVMVTEHVKCLENGCLCLFSILFAPSHSSFLSPGLAWFDLSGPDWHLMEHCPDGYGCMCLCESMYVRLFILKRAKDQRNVTGFGTGHQSTLSGNIPVSQSPQEWAVSDTAEITLW